ncbi:MAG: EAL domain-containing protein [Myxococcota bacterium]
MRRFGLRARILTTLLVVIVSLQAITSLFVLERTRREAEAHATSQLEAGGRVFERLLADRERQLLHNVAVLVGDFGLRKAVATQDRPTIESALANHAARIRADLAFVLDLAGGITAITTLDPQRRPDGEGFRELVEAAHARGAAAGLALAAGRPHQVVLAPVKAPRIVGWIGMAFELDGELASDLRTLTGLEVSFWSRGATSEVTRIASTLPRDEVESLSLAIRAGALTGREGEPAQLAGSDWISLPVTLESLEGESAGAVLQTSRSEALAPFSAQRAELLRFFALGLALALGVSIWTARRLARPIDALASAAQTISAGDLHAPLEVEESADELGRLAHSFRVMQDALVEREQRIVHESMHDRLTGLPNRNALDAALAAAIATGEPFSVVLLDVLRLKDTNDRLGAAIGDGILRRTAERLRAARGVDWAARIGGDEFLAIVPEADEERLDSLLDGLLGDLERPLSIRGARVVSRLAAGYVIAYADGGDPETLVRRAEMALALAKSRSDATARYEVGLEESNHRRVGILIELERALDRRDLELHYQPKIHVASERVVGAEALIRWTHETLGRMNPQEFIEIAEQTGLIGRISAWALEEAATRVARWSERGLDLVVSVNLSAHDATEDDLPDRLSEILVRTGAAARCLKLEVTESAVMRNPKQAASILERIRTLGVGISIDDFGTGHSSLAQLQALPVDELKIDQAFVRDLRAGTPNEVIVRTTIDLAHSLGLEVVAEGVEDRATWRLLARHGCDVAQGFFMGRPMPESAFLEWIDRFRKEGLDG